MPIRTPNINWNCHRLVAWLAATSPAPSSSVPDKHDDAGAEPVGQRAPEERRQAHARKSIVAAADTPLRDQPIASEIGCRNTASDSIDAEADAGHQRARADDDPAVGNPEDLLMRFLALFCIYI